MTRRHRAHARLLLGGALAMVLLGGCVAAPPAVRDDDATAARGAGMATSTIPAPPTEDADPQPAPTAAAAAPAVAQAATPAATPPATETPHGDVEAPSAPASVTMPAIAATSPERLARRVTVRVRALGCGRIGTASAVAVGHRLLVTNRHVVAGADRIELNFWDGTLATARPTIVAVADDLALVRVSRRLPTVATVADDDAAQGTRVFVVGFPNGGRQSVAWGDVVEYAALEQHPDASPVMRLSAPIMAGNSGGPVLDSSGAVVGVVFGIETTTGQGLAVPASAMVELLERQDEGARAPGCS